MDTLTKTKIYDKSLEDLVIRANENMKNAQQLINALKQKRAKLVIPS